jgi:hypothetical protein
MGLAIGFTHRFWPGPIAPEVKRLQFKIYLWGFLAFQLTTIFFSFGGSPHIRYERNSVFPLVL